MKAGVSCWCFNAPLNSGEAALDDVIRFVGKETEAEAIELLTRFFDEHADENEQAKEAKKLIDDVGLKVSCYTLDSDFAVLDDAACRACIERCIQRIDTALILGTDTIRVDPRSSFPKEAQENLNPDEHLPKLAQAMQKVADAAAAKEVQVGVENHGRLFGSSRQIAEIVRLVGRPNFGVNIDPTNFKTVYGEDHLEAVRLLARHVTHVHLKDMSFADSAGEGDDWREIPTGEWSRKAVMGEGDGQPKEVIRILHDAGFDGVISLEMPGPADPFDGVKKGVANLKKMIQEVTG